MNIGNIPPSILRSINANPMQWKIALAEAVDNSFDSNSTSVRIVFKAKNNLEIIDDGNGCDDIQEMLTVGRHYRQATTKLGRFGVGLKELACWLWGELVIETVHNRILRTASVDWERLAKQDHWNIPDAIENKASTERGTRLMFNRTTRNTPDLAVLAEEMGYLFAPAIWLGKQIVIESTYKKIPVIAWKLPEFEGEAVRDTFFVNGKQVDLVAGVVALDAINTRKGFTYIHEHRQLLNSALGSKGKSVSRVCGTVVLGAEWKLGKNKDAIQDSDDQIIALENEISYRCEDIFLRAESQSQMLRNSALEDSVTDCLKSLVAGLAQENKDRKARRASRGGKSGAVKPADSARSHKKAEIEQDGNTFSSVSNMGQLRMEWESKADKSIGWFDVSGKVLYLNDLHTRLLHHKQAENRDAIADICCTILVSTVITNRESVLLPCVRDCSDLKTALAIVLATQQQSDESVHA